MQERSRWPTVRRSYWGFRSGEFRMQPNSPIRVPAGRDIPGRAQAARSILLVPAPAYHYKPGRAHDLRACAPLTTGLRKALWTG